jgi:two-component system, sensor histidine kinase YesM
MIIHPIKKFYEYVLNLKLMQKLLLSYFALVIIPLGVLSLIFYNTVAQIVEKRITFSAEQAFEQTYSYLSYKIYNIREKSDILLKNPQMLAILNNGSEYDNLIKQLRDMGDLQAFLMSLEDSSNILRVRMYIDDSLLYSRENRNLFSMNNISKAKWYNLLEENNRNHLWIPSSYLEDDYTPLMRDELSHEEILSLGKIVLNPVNYLQSIAAVRFDFNKNTIVNILNKANTVKNSISYILNSQGHIVAYSSAPMLEKYILESPAAAARLYSASPLSLYYFDKEPALISCQLLENTDWYMITVIPLREILSESKQVRNKVLLLMLVLGTAAYILAFIISYSINKRISYLAHRMKQVHRGKLEPIKKPAGKDEIGELVEDYNYMIERLRILIDEQYISGQELKSAELKALQAQINPHFLYNTLDMINWYAWKNSGPEIIQVVEALAKFYKLSLNKGKDIISIKDELNHVSCYFQIQNMRFKNNLKLHIDADEEIEHCSILKITLQPIIENSILHGILCKDNKAGNIYLSVRLIDDSILLRIEDDGVGMTAEKLEKILYFEKKSDTGNGFGISNINQRIKLYYGNNYGLCYQSVPGKGTIVEIIIPAHRKK